MDTKLPFFRLPTIIRVSSIVIQHRALSEFLNIIVIICNNPVYLRTFSFFQARNYSQGEKIFGSFSIYQQPFLTFYEYFH